MTNDVFNLSNLNKHFVGFDKVLDTLTNVNDTYTKAILNNSPNWPPYNIVKIDDNNYSIELAVAGFGKHNLDIELANNTLVVKGGFTVDEIDPIDNPVQYLWKGIADRMFTRKFTLADTVEVKNAEYVNGMLKIFLENVVPEEKKPKKVDIK
jgi:molecular chaperone IbpA